MLAPIVDDAWLTTRLAGIGSHEDENRSPRLVVVHVGTTMTGSDPHAEYLRRRLPGARYVSLDDDLAGPAAPIVGRHPLPSRSSFEDLLDELGVTSPDARDDPSASAEVVAYDDRNGGFASRLVWMLRVLGHSAALLDRGGRPLPAADPADAPDPGSPRRPRTSDQTSEHTSEQTGVNATDWPSTLLADGNDVAAHIAAGGIVVDSRSADRYAGLVEPIDAVAGHIPGAINLPFTDNLDSNGRFRPPSELAARFAELSTDAAPIVSCGSGVTACHNALAIESTGLPLPRVYIGSWSGWSTDPDRPIATGAA